jgi:hypothetical protein
MKLEELTQTPMIGESELAKYWRIAPDTIYAESKSTNRTVETIASNVALVKSLNDHNPVKLIISITKSPVPDKATRELAAKELPLTYSAMAMIAPNKLTGFIINLIYGMKKPPIPMRTFSNFEEAHRWISGLVVTK